MIVADQDAPTAVLRAPDGSAPFGRSFDPRRQRSFDVGGGKVVQYVWTYLGPDRTAERRWRASRSTSRSPTREPTVTVDAGCRSGGTASAGRGRREGRASRAGRGGRRGAARSGTGSSSGSRLATMASRPRPDVGGDRSGSGRSIPGRRHLGRARAAPPSRARRRSRHEPLSRAPEADPLYARPARGAAQLRHRHAARRAGLHRRADLPPRPARARAGVPHRRRHARWPAREPQSGRRRPAHARRRSASSPASRSTGSAG